MAKGKHGARVKTACDNIYCIFSTRSTAESLEAMRESCKMSSELEFVVPESYERPWNCP